MNKFKDKYRSWIIATIVLMGLVVAMSDSPLMPFPHVVALIVMVIICEIILRKRRKTMPLYLITVGEAAEIETDNKKTMERMVEELEKSGRTYVVNDLSSKLFEGGRENRKKGR